MNSVKRGFTLVEIMIVILIIGLLLALAVPNFVKSRTEARLNWVVSNLDTLEKAYAQCMLEQGDTANDCETCTSDFVAYKYLNGYEGLSGVTNDDEFEFTCGYIAYRGKSREQWLADQTGL